MASFVLTADALTPLASSPKKGKVTVLLGIYSVLVGLVAVAAWRTCMPESLQRQVSSVWSPFFVVLLFILYVYLHLVFYPLPPSSHHLDKLLPLGILSIAWCILYVFQPNILAMLFSQRIYFWIKVVFVNFLLFVLVGEIQFRVADPWLAKVGLFGDKQTPANLTPHIPVGGSLGRTNSQGFRDLERQFERTSDAPRIVALGDSYTYGVGVLYDQSFTTLVERGLQEENPGIEIVNLGVPGWETLTEYHLLKTYGIRFSPDFVMLNFFVGNDIVRRRGMDHEKGIVVAGHSYYVHTNGSWFHDTFAPDRLYLYHNLRYVMKMGSIRLRLASNSDDVVRDGFDHWVKLLSRQDYLREIDQRSDTYIKPDTPFFAGRWKHTRNTLKDMKEFLDSRGVSLVLVAMPSQEQSDAILQKELLGALKVTPDQFEWEKPQRLLRKWAKENSVEFLDLLPVFRAHPDPARLYLPNDMHMTVQGHQLAAAAMLPQLRRIILDHQ